MEIPIKKDDLFKILNKSTLENSDIIFLMTETRKAIESYDEWKKNLKWLNFYCDWCVHSKIDRNPNSIDVIRELNKTLWNIDDNGQSTGNITNNLAAFFNIPELLNELQLLLSAIYGQFVKPTMTFVRSLFTYLADIPIVPVDSPAGKLNPSNKEYKKILSELKLDQQRPLIKNIVINGWEENILLCSAKMADNDCMIKLEITFDMCTEFPFLIKKPSIVKCLSPQEVAISKWQNISMLIQRNQLNQAYTLLKNLKCELDSLQGIDNIKMQVYANCFEIGWTLTGDSNVFEDGEKAITFTTDIELKIHIFCNLATYAMQKNMFSEAKNYIDSALQLSEIMLLRIRPLYLLGRLSRLQGLYSEAIKYYNESSLCAKELHVLPILVDIYYEIAETWKLMGKWDIAFSELTKAEQYAGETCNFNALMSCTVLKAQWLLECGDTNAAMNVIKTIPKQNN